MNEFDLNVVIINYRTPHMTIDCVSSVLPELSDMSAIVTIVDNNSGDDSVYIIQNWIEKNKNSNVVKFIESSINHGFSGGNNLGINAFKSKYNLLLNSDTVIKKGAIRALISSMESNSDIGLITPRLESSDGTLQESCFNFISPISEFIAAARTGFIYKLLSKFVVPLPVIESISSPPWSSFACVLIRNEVFDDVGLLDDGFFMYYEDTEFCYRARKSGWNIINEPESQVIHLCGKSSSFNDDVKSKKRPPRYFYESRSRYFFLVYGRSGLLMANVLWLLGRVISKSIQIMGRSNKSTPERQWLDIWINFYKPLSGKENI